MNRVSRVSSSRFHDPRRHAAVRTKEYVFSQLIPYIGNKRKLLHLIGEAVESTGCQGGTFVDLFTGSTVVARWAKTAGFRVIANDWEPYSYEIARGTVALSAPPAFVALGGVDRVFEHLNALPPLHGYVATHLCPADDEHPDVARERMFFTRANGERIDAMREQVAAWEAEEKVSADQRAYILSALIYATSYASNTSGVFKGFHCGWGGKTATALYRIRGTLTLVPPVLLDNGLANLALREDAQKIASDLGRIADGPPEIVYIDPPYNQHPYGSNYHVLNTVALWDKPPLCPSICSGGKVRDKSAIRKDWRTERRSPYNSQSEALPALEQLIGSLDARWALVSYSTDGNMPLRAMLSVLASRGDLRVVTEKYKRYRVSTPRMSPKSHNIEFVAVVDLKRPPSGGRVDAIVADILQEEQATRSSADYAGQLPLF
jgi:adenine-specific DNA-methyltransferase